jgi:glyceraldehyde-3-phosphate dehydrogenase (NAD(P))
MRIVHVIGTGTVGEPLIGLLAENMAVLGIDEVTFHKRTPLPDEIPKIGSLLSRGARLAADEGQRGNFALLGFAPSFEAIDAIQRATVVIDCTPAGLENKQAIYSKINGPAGFLAQGSEHGFGKPYALGINDQALKAGDRFVQVVSCNTHNISVLIKTLGIEGGRSILGAGRFVCMRRSNDISQDGSFAPSPTVDEHDDQEFGTHHARDCNDLFLTVLGHDLPLWSSVIKLNTQYMHAIWFSLELRCQMSRGEALGLLSANPRVTMTKKMSANKIFSFGRDHGYYGRILSQTVVPEACLASRGSEVVGFCYTPQDGNAILSSVAATMWYLHGSTERVEALSRYSFRNV